MKKIKLDKEEMKKIKGGTTDLEEEDLLQG